MKEVPQWFFLLLQVVIFHFSLILLCPLKCWMLHSTSEESTLRYTSAKISHKPPKDTIGLHVTIHCQFPHFLFPLRVSYFFFSRPQLTKKISPVPKSVCSPCTDVMFSWYYTKWTNFPSGVCKWMKMHPLLLVSLITVKDILA